MSEPALPDGAGVGPVAALSSLSLDLDNEWTYLRTHGDPGWESYPSYLPLVVPRILEFFERNSLRATIFVVGQDALHTENLESLRSLADAGHEIANHSHSHEPWLHLYTEEKLNEELELAEEASRTATGAQVNGFRMVEGNELASGLVLTEIRQRGLVFSYRDYRFIVGN